MQQLGFKSVRSLKLGIKGWNDNDFAMIDAAGKTADIDKADEWLNTPVPAENLSSE